ncbi:hypothetical protein BCF74_13814 [Knoellia remsis]|uniref:Uncharacterized protein n=1 Tax=Knoellia remsis TaxID=407159 RepID=A0A2T0TYP0_9MICO|nr:hypothetical protein [Knoellia remsis]PRY50792.1 hypothetical protein BCF74_13814 [Knoellia remsis]
MREYIMTTLRATAPDAETPAVPPLRPDPALMDNSEGNETLLAQDRRRAEEYLERLGLEMGQAHE